MGLGISLKGLMPRRQEAVQGEVAQATPPSATLVAAPPPVAAPPVAAPPPVIAPPAATAPAAAAPPPSEGAKKVENDIMNLFVVEEAQKSPFLNLMASLPEVDISGLYKECQEARNRLMGC